MKRNDWKYLVDVLLFVDMCSIAAIGLLMGFVIPAGGGQSSSKYFLGLHRHQWGDLHLYLSLFLLALLVLHIWLNWTWIVNTTRSAFGEKWKKALGVLSLAWVIVLIVGWILMKLSR